MGIVRTRTHSNVPRTGQPVAPLRASTVTTSETRPRADAFERGNGGSVVTALKQAGKVTRSTGPEGVEAMVTPFERERALKVLSQNPDVKTAVEKLLSPLSEVRAGVLLRAVSARAEALSGASTSVALAELRELGGKLSGLDDVTARRRATSLDLDSTVNHSTADPIPWWDRRGVVRDRVGDVDAADNDGLFQRFTASCGTTVIQMMLAEADPAYAFFLHQNEIHSDDVTGPIAEFQRKLLEPGGGIALGRREAFLRARLRNALGRLTSSGEVTRAQKEALLGHALKGAPLSAPARRALDIVRASYEGFPSSEDLQRLRHQRLPDKDEGLASEAFIAALESVITPRTGLRYESTDPPEGFERGKAGRHLDTVEAILKRGVDVPFGISEPAHWMLLSAVRGEEPRREFLVSDPDGGRTAWVKEKDFLSGTFADKQFHLSKKDERPYVDVFILPKL